jgi:hypothetical protein
MKAIYFIFKRKTKDCLPHPLLLKNIQDPSLTYPKTLFFVLFQKEVSAQLWKTLYDFPELQKCKKLQDFINESVTLAWKMSVQTPPIVIHYEADTYLENMHTRFYASNKEGTDVKYHVWPALIDSKTGHVFYRGVVVT